MVTKALVASAFLLLIMVGWVAVQQLYRNFARNNPECGPFREDGGNTACSCCASRQYCSSAR